MEQVTGAPAEGKDSEDEQNAPDSSSPTGKTADQDQQILVDTGDTNWFKSTQALKHLQPVFVPIVKDKMKSLQLQSMTDFGRELCAEATSDDIIRANDNLAQFKHLCPGTVIACQNLLNIIKGHTTDSVRFYQMLIGTDPQNWLKSPFEFARLFLKDWMRRDIHDFQECDITALCTIVKRCKPLMQIFDERKFDELRKVRNRTMHPATMSITQQDMEENINVILEFLEHIKALTASDEATKAIEYIKQLRTGDVSLLHTVVDRLIRGWIHDAKIEYELKLDAKNNQHQDINYMENKLARMSSAQEATAPTKQSEEQELEAKCTVTEGRDSDANLYLHPVPSRAGENADQDHQEGERGEITFGLMRDWRRRRKHVPTLIERMCLCCKKADDFDENTYSLETLDLPTPGPADVFDENTYSLETLGQPTLGPADDFDENTYSLETLGQPTPCPADDFNENTYCLETLGRQTLSPEWELGEITFGLMRDRRRRLENVPTLIQRMCLCCKKADDLDENTYSLETVGLTTLGPADDFDENTYSLETLGQPTPDPEGERGEITFGLMLERRRRREHVRLWTRLYPHSLHSLSLQCSAGLHAYTVAQGDDSDEQACFMNVPSTAGNKAAKLSKLMPAQTGGYGRVLPLTTGENADEVHQYTVAQGDDSDEQACYINVPSTAGENADEVHQILTDESDTNWFKTMQSLMHLHPVLLSFLEDKIIRLHEETLTDFGRQLCTKATSDDIIRARGNVAQFKHLCPGTVVTCQNLIIIIKGHTRDSVDFYQMLKGTDPQNWLKSPFEFARLFLKDWMRSDIHDFQECDILALCTIIKRCKPLMQIFDERKLDELRNVRNRTMHPHTMSICQHETEDHINSILDFLQHMKTLKNTDEVIKAMESITQSRTDDVRNRQSIFVRLIQGWLPGARMEYKHKLDEANNQLKDINYMEKKLVKVSTAQASTERIT